VWAGKHPQSPISVVAKPHYWAELAVIPTIQRFLDDCPDFWSSEELLDTFKSGAFLAMDYRFFLEVNSLSHVSMWLCSCCYENTTDGCDSNDRVGLYFGLPTIGKVQFLEEE
jgi:hypothetical protein